MQSRNQSYTILIGAVALLLLGVLGAYWPRWVEASPASSTLAPSATIADAITYQGYLTDANDVPLTGTFTMQFEIYNAATDGDLLWDGGSSEISVQDGLFETKLEITTDIFNGEELWVAQTIDGELLTPRQEILPAPMAHTLRPGAIVKGTANALPNNYLLDVQMNNDAFGFNRGAISGQSTTGNAIYGLAANGRAIYGQTEDGYAVYGFDGGSNANRGYAGYFYSTNGIGVYGYSNGDRTHPNILAPGVYGQSNQGVGVYGRGDTSNSYSFYNEGGYFEGGKGIYARGTDSATQLGYGARIFSTNYRGMYVRGATGSFDAYFGGTGGISAQSYVDRVANSQSLVVNSGDTAIEPGDLVAMVGVAESPENGQPMLAVANVNDGNSSAVIGVAKEAVSHEIVALEDGSEYVDFAPTVGAVAPNSYLVIITDGLAPAVNLAGLSSAGAGNPEGINADVSSADMTTLSATWKIGSKIAVSAGGRLESSSSETGSVVDSIVIGKVAGPVDLNSGTIPLFIDID